MRGAARVGFTFSIDPVVHLSSPLPHQLIREAGALVIAADLAEARKDGDRG